MRARPLVLVLALVTAACSGGGQKPEGGGSGPSNNPPSEAGDVPSELADLELIFSGEDGTYVARADGSEVRKAFDLEDIWEFQADVSPDGKRVALRADEEPPRGGTWLIGIGANEALNLTQKAGLRGGAADWSPDGRSLVLTGKREDESHFGLWVVRTDGSSARRITPASWEAQYPAWSPDGNLIAFTKVVPPDDFELYVISPDGTGLRQVTQSDGYDNYAAWSPDGKQLVFSREHVDKSGLWLINLDGSGERFLTQGGEPQWEPGRWIIFDCALGSEARVRGCVISPDGSGLTELPIDEQVSFPNWLP
jgi:TolB protein